MEELQSVVNALSASQIRLEEQVKTLFKQQSEMKALTETVQELALAVKLQAESLKSTQGAVTGLRTDVDELRERPAKRWDSAVGVAVTAIVTAVVTYILTRMGLK